MPLDIYDSIFLFLFFMAVVEITKYVHISSVRNYNFKVLLLYLSIPNFCYFILRLHYISEENRLLFCYK